MTPRFVEARFGEQLRLARERSRLGLSDWGFEMA